MALFGGQRDMSLFRTINKELINDVIDTEVYYYKVIIDESKTNLYGEGKDKVYYNPVKMPSIITREESSETFDEFGTSYTRNATFAFLRDTLVARKSQLKIQDDFRVGINRDNNDLPVGI